MAFVAISADMFDLYFDGQDDGLVMSDPIVMDTNIIKEAPDDLNIKEAKVEKKRDD